MITLKKLMSNTSLMRNKIPGFTRKLPLLQLFGFRFERVLINILYCLTNSVGKHPSFPSFFKMSA
jgi:hypothetical protein